MESHPIYGFAGYSSKKSRLMIFGLVSKKLRDLKRNIERKNKSHNDIIISDLMNKMKGEKYISTAVDYSSLFSFNLCCIIMPPPHPMGANSFFFILNLRLFSRKKQSKVTSLEIEENTDIQGSHL